MITLEQARSIIPDIAKLSTDQFDWIRRLIQAMALPVETYRNPQSDVFTDNRVGELFFLYLVTHHTLAIQAFKQEKFEYALEQILTRIGRTATLPQSRTNPGHDLTVDSERWSLKTAADMAIRADPINLTKWMELGKGNWTNKVEDLHELRNRFLKHLNGYDRIFVLRYLTPGQRVKHHYEIIEIPKKLLLQAKKGVFALSTRSRQTTIIPGTCTVSIRGKLGYELYFDGGSERKLKLQKLRRELCIVHAEWKFQTPEPEDVLSSGE